MARIFTLNFAYRANLNSRKARFYLGAADLNSRYARQFILLKSIKPHRQLIPHNLRCGVSAAVEQVELDVAAGAADGAGVFNGHLVVDRRVSRAVPDLDRAGRNDDFFAVRVDK